MQGRSEYQVYLQEGELSEKFMTDMRSSFLAS